MHAGNMGYVTPLVFHRLAYSFVIMRKSRRAALYSTSCVDSSKSIGFASAGRHFCESKSGGNDSIFKHVLYGMHAVTFA